MNLSSFWLRIFDFAIGIIITLCGIYAVYLMVNSPHANTDAMRVTLYNFALAGIAITFGIGQLIFAFRRHVGRKKEA